MKRTPRWLVVGVLAMLALVPRVQAGVTADVSVIPGPVATQPGQVSFSRPGDEPTNPNKPVRFPPLTTYVAYKVFAQNTGTNTVNHIRTVLQSASITNLPTSSLTFSQVIDPAGVGVTCGFEGSPQQFVCTIQQLRALGSTAGPSEATFYIVFTTPFAPLEGTAGPFLANYDWQVFYGEGANDSLNAAHPDGSQGSFPTQVALTTFTTGDQARDLKSVVPKKNSRTVFFTGTSIATPSDVVTTTLDLPPLPAGVATTTAEIFERKPGDLLPGTFSSLTCPTELPTCTDVLVMSVPGVVFTTFSDTNPPIVVTLRKDAKSWSGSARSVPLYYSHTDAAPFALIPDCTTGLPASGQPCVKERKKLTKGDSADPDAVGDLQITVWLVDNGRIGW